MGTLLRALATSPFLSRLFRQEMTRARATRVYLNSIIITTNNAQVSVLGRAALSPISQPAISQGRSARRPRCSHGEITVRDRPRSGPRKNLTLSCHPPRVSL